MDFTGHARFKMSLYRLNETDVENAIVNSVIAECEDSVENSKVTIFQMLGITWAAVKPKDGERIITIYPTDNWTVLNRRRKGRWNCE